MCLNVFFVFASISKLLISGEKMLILEELEGFVT